jgi:hypothetical protein
MKELEVGIAQMNQEIMNLKLLKPPRKKKGKVSKKSRGGSRGIDN